MRVWIIEVWITEDLLRNFVLISSEKTIKAIWLGKSIKSAKVSWADENCEKGVTVIWLDKSGTHNSWTTCVQKCAVRLNELKNQSLMKVFGQWQKQQTTSFYWWRHFSIQILVFLTDPEICRTTLKCTSTLMIMWKLHIWNLEVYIQMCLCLILLQ